MNEKTIDLPGYCGANADLIAAMLDEIHDIAKELTYIDNADLSGLDKNNGYFVGAAFDLATRRAHAELADIMLDIRNMRTPIEPREKKHYRVLASKYVRTSETNV